jgi:transcriptional regulator with XRE-family HTH domain
LTPKQLKLARKKLGDIRQEELAEMIGIRWARTIRKWEAGERAIPEPVSILINLFLDNPVLIHMSKRYRPGYIENKQD